MPNPSQKKIFNNYPIINRLKPTQLNPGKLSLYLIVLISLWHLALAPLLDLTIDEAHYAIYGLKPALSYFDHPPLVGWIQMPFMALLPNDLGARLAPILLMALLSYLLYQLAVNLFNDKWIGFWSIVFLNFNLMFQLLGMALLPELPFLIFALLAILIVLKMRETTPTPAHWITLGLALGLAGLAKYTAFILVISLIVLVLVEKRWNWIFNWRTLLGVLTALLVISPVVIWNMSHDWASIEYQLNHTLGATSWEISRAQVGVVSQLITYSPLIYLLALALMLVGWRINPTYRLPIIFALPIILFIAYSSGYKRALPHWVALAFIVMLPVLIHFLKTHWNKIWLRYLVFANGALSLGLILFLNFIIVFQWLPETSEKNGVRQIFGWQAAIERALELQKDHPDAKLFVNNWTHASRVAWYAYPQPVFITSSKKTQFDFWYSKATNTTQGLVIIPSYNPKVPLGRGASNFTNCQKLDELKFAPKNKELALFRFYLCTNYQSE